MSRIMCAPCAGYGVDDPVSSPENTPCYYCGGTGRIPGGPTKGGKLFFCKFCERKRIFWPLPHDDSGAIWKCGQCGNTDPIGDPAATLGVVVTA